MGGDASILHLISQMDSGISRQIRLKTGERADFFRKIFSCLRPLKYLLLFVYIMMTQFEYPAFCLDIINQKEKNP